MDEDSMENGLRLIFWSAAPEYGIEPFSQILLQSKLVCNTPEFRVLIRIDLQNYTYFLREQISYEDVS